MVVRERAFGPIPANANEATARGSGAPGAFAQKSPARKRGFSQRARLLLRILLRLVGRVALLATLARVLRLLAGLLVRLPALLAGSLTALVLLAGRLTALILLAALLILVR